MSTARQLCGATVRSCALASLVLLLLASDVQSRAVLAHAGSLRRRRDHPTRRSALDPSAQQDASTENPDVLNSTGLLNVLWDELAAGIVPTGLPDLTTTVPLERSTQRREMMQLLHCINSGHAEIDILSWSAAMADKMGSVQAVGLWWSRQAIQIPLTVVTTATLSRMNQLQASCVSWPGPYSVVLYEPLLQERPGPLTTANRQRLSEAVAEVSLWVSDMQRRVRACQPNVMLVYELFTDRESAAALFPYNMLRNMARLQVHTPLIAMVDVDLLLSRSLHARMADPQRAAELVMQARDERKVFIIPAFDLHSEFQDGLWAETLASSSKSMAADAYRQGVLDSFSRHAFAAGHNLTHYEKWVSAREDYATEYELKCEPWLIVDRLSVPWHDERYRGYGMDKVQHVAHLNASGCKFTVLHDAFTIHRPHHKSVGKVLWNAGKGKTLPHRTGAKTRGSVGQTITLFAHNTGLLEAQQEQTTLGTFQPALSPATIACRNTLAW